MIKEATQPNLQALAQQLTDLLPFTYHQFDRNADAYAHPHKHDFVSGYRPYRRGWMIQNKPNPITKMPPEALAHYFCKVSEDGTKLTITGKNGSGFFAARYDTYEGDDSPLYDFKEMKIVRELRKMAQAHDIKVEAKYGEGFSPTQTLEITASSQGDLQAFLERAIPSLEKKLLTRVQKITIPARREDRVNATKNTERFDDAIEAYGALLEKHAMGAKVEKQLIQLEGTLLDITRAQHGKKGFKPLEKKLAQLLSKHRSADSDITERVTTLQEALVAASRDGLHTQR